MGFSLSRFRQQYSSSSPQGLGDQQQNTKHGNRSACSGMSFMMLLGCLWTKETKQKQLEDQKQLKQQQVENKAKEVSTLEDWLIDSPGFLRKKNGISVGEYHVFKHSSKRVFPSFDGEMANSSFSKKKLLKSEDGIGSEEMEVSLCWRQSGKSKKRVSFRVPEEADIFIFHSSPAGEEESEEKEII